MKYILLLTVLLCAGCDFYVHDYEIAGFSKACENNGGLAKISNLHTVAQCNDGSWVNWYE